MQTSTRPPSRIRSALVVLLVSTGIAAADPAWSAGNRHAESAQAGSAPRSSPPLIPIADVPLPGATTRFDYQSYDPLRHRLFIAHLGDSAVVVFDTTTRAVLETITGIDHVHGVLAEPALGRVFATATGRNQVTVIDEASLRVVARISAGVYPDGLAYAPEARKLYVSDETGGTETVIDVRRNRPIASIPLGGEAGNTQYDAVSGHVFVNVQTRNELVEIDPAHDAIARRLQLPGCKNNHGLYVDPAVHLAYIACTENDRLLVLDLDRMRVVQSATIGRDPDVLAFDPGLRVLYIASESGTVSLFRREGGTLVKLGDARIAPHAHSIAVDPQTHLVYLPLQDIEGRPVLRIMAPAFAP